MWLSCHHHVQINNDTIPFQLHCCTLRTHHELAEGACVVTTTTKICDPQL